MIKSVHIRKYINNFKIVTVFLQKVVHFCLKSQAELLYQITNIENE